MIDITYTLSCVDVFFILAIFNSTLAHDSEPKILIYVESEVATVE